MKKNGEKKEKETKKNERTKTNMKEKRKLEIGENHMNRRGFGTQEH